MAYSAEIVARARARLAQSREDRESENRQHLAAAYAQVPRLREIDIELRKTMAQAAQAAFSSGSDPAEAMGRVRDRNLALQRERAQLVEANFEEGYLDETPICQHCGGTGYVGSQMCECLAELCRQEQKKEISILSGGRESFSQFRLDYYPDSIDPALGASPRKIMERNFRTCRSYAMRFSMEAGNLLFIGGTGLGKTFLSACIARTVADRGYSVVYETAARLFANIEQNRFNATEETRRAAAKYESCDLLILDDLGTEIYEKNAAPVLYGLLNDRLVAGRPMVVSTNLIIEEIRQRYSPQVASRLEGGFTRLTFVGEDIRVLKNRGG